MALQEDRYNALDDEALLRHLNERADRRREHLTIEQRAGQWDRGVLSNRWSLVRTVRDAGSRRTGSPHGDAGPGAEVRRK